MTAEYVIEMRSFRVVEEKDATFIDRRNDQLIMSKDQKCDFKTILEKRYIEVKLSTDMKRRG